MTTVNVAVTRLQGRAPDQLFDECARIHREEIPTGFLSSLGPNFLTKLYRALASSPHSFLFAATVEDEVLGFIAGSMDTSRVYKRFVLRSGFSVAPALFVRLLSVKTLRRVAETLFYPNKQKVVDLPPSEILNFCVSSRAQRQGIGKKLFLALVDEFRRRGVKRIRIVTGAEQKSAQRFYESLQARPAARIQVHRGEDSLVYVYDLPKNSGPAAGG